MHDLQHTEGKGPVVVIAEHGSKWTAWARELRLNPGDAAVVAQQIDESPESFADRVVQRLAILGACAHTGVLALDAPATDQRWKSRKRIALALAQALRKGDSAALVFAAHAGFPEAARHELLALAESAVAGRFGGPLAVRVGFADPEGPGVRATRPAADGAGKQRA